MTHRHFNRLSASIACLIYPPCLISKSHQLFCSIKPCNMLLYVAFCFLILNWFFLCHCKNYVIFHKTCAKKNLFKCVTVNVIIVCTYICRHWQAESPVELSLSCEQWSMPPSPVCFFVSVIDTGYVVCMLAQSWFHVPALQCCLS